MSRTVCTYPIVGALVALEELIGPCVWIGVNPVQEAFLSKAFLPGRGDLEALQQVEGVSMDHIAAVDAELINTFLADYGFDIHLDPFRPGEIGAAAVTKAALQWAVAGYRTSIVSSRGREFPAFGLKEGVVSFYQSPRHSQTIARLSTKNPQLSVYVTPFEEDALPESDLALGELARGLLAGAGFDFRYDSLAMPMVDLNHKPDISWLLNMESVPWFISQALQQTVLRMNELGFLAESGAAVGARKGIGEGFVIRDPFLAWIEIESLSQPFLVSHVTEEAWKDPGVIKELAGANHN